MRDVNGILFPIRIIYNLDYGKISQVIAAHDDAVSCLSSVKGSEILVSGSWDCSVK